MNDPIDLSEELLNHRGPMKNMFTHNILNIIMTLHDSSDAEDDQKLAMLSSAFTRWWNVHNRSNEDKIALLADPKLNPFAQLNTESATDCHTIIFDIIQQPIREELQKLHFDTKKNSPLKKSLGVLIDHYNVLWDNPNKAKHNYLARHKHLGYALAVTLQGLLEQNADNAEKIIHYGDQISGRVSDSHFSKRLGSILLAVGAVLGAILILSSIILALAIPPSVPGVTFLLLYVFAGTGLAGGSALAGLLLRLHGKQRCMSSKTSEVGQRIFTSLYPASPNNLKIRFMQLFGIKPQERADGYRPVGGRVAVAQRVDINEAEDREDLLKNIIG